MLSLTSKGRTLLRRDPLDATVSALQTLGAVALPDLAHSLETLLAARLNAQERQPFGQCGDCRYFANRHPDGSPHYCLLLKEKLAVPDSLAICYEQLPAEQQ